MNGSPKKKSDTFCLTDAFLKGMNRQGTHEVHIVNVIDKKIAPCRGRFGCWQRGDGHCVIRDDQNAILDLYRTADVIIWSFPLYCYGMPSHLKAVLDRTIPLVKMKESIQKEGVARSILARLLFSSRDINKPVYILSGGEKIRLCFARLFTSAANVLILDEPTNYLDIPSVEALERLFSEYEGTMLFASHDGSFVNAVATERFLISDHKITPL